MAGSSGFSGGSGFAEAFLQPAGATAAFAIQLLAAFDFLLGHDDSLNKNF
jgi:hypothetical protein